MKINDSFIISSTLTNKIIDIKKYSLVTDEFLDDLRQKNQNEKISIYCGCSDKLDMNKINDEFNREMSYIDSQIFVAVNFYMDILEYEASIESKYSFKSGMLKRMLFAIVKQ